MCIQFLFVKSKFKRYISNKVGSRTSLKMLFSRINKEYVLEDISNVGVVFHKNDKENKPGSSVNRPIVSEQKRKTLTVKPFQCGTSRFPKIKQETTPGPGTYNHDIPCNRKIQFYCSFGGPQTLRTSIKVICKNDLKDMCTNCLNEPIGDYYKNSKNKSLCRPCYDIFKKNLPEEEHKRLFSQFFKVRDCSDIHFHEATNAKLRLKSEKDIKKIKLKEAYLSLYYD